MIHATGEGAFSCCGIGLPVQEAETSEEDHEISVEQIENDYYVTLEHPMTKEHYLSFMAYVTSDRVQLVKLYPEQSPAARFSRVGHGVFYVYCNRHGLYTRKP